MSDESATGSTPQRPFFVYGTLKPGEPNYDAYLAGRGRSEQAALLRHAALFSDGTYPYMITDARVVRPDDTVYGVVMDVAPEHFHEVLERLDWLEDYKPNSPWSLYDRVRVTVETAVGPVEVWTYVGGPQSLAAIRAGRLVYIPGGIWSAYEPGSAPCGERSS